MFSSTFWKAAAERAAKTFAQAALALLVGDGIGVLDIDWGKVGSVGLLAAVASLLTSLVSAPFGPVGSPSVVEDEKATDAL
ncbi:holin [Dactylosporangium sp. NPDC000244]|uniref:holin n=1 Tax=Dactylosporangium sp. NPDC000244 TaxID=3154365 RepID=UPI0033229A02